jgi:hypothetical protein
VNLITGKEGFWHAVSVSKFMFTRKNVPLHMVENTYYKYLCDVMKNTTVAKEDLNVGTVCDNTLGPRFTVYSYS